MKYKSVSFILVLMVILNIRTFSQISIFQEPEELYYEVYYSFINVGWVKFNNKLIDNNKYISTAVLKSNDALPFININYEFNTEYLLDGNDIKVLKSIQREIKDGKISTQYYEFKYDSGYVWMHKTGFNNEAVFDKKLPLDKNYQDGLSIFYMARIKSLNKSSDKLNVIMNDDSSSVLLNFKPSKEEQDVDDIDYPVSAIQIDGFAFFKAVFGLTGDFRGYFSNDNRRVPLKALLEVSIGKISLDLKSWKLKSWVPPKA